MNILSWLLTLGFGAFAVYELVTFTIGLVKLIKEKKANKSKESEENKNIKKED